ncbi:MAG: DUF368 domain-containing protein [Cyclobacteriaceae bacterium]
MLNRIILLLKGMAMGGADVIPGVSGGTIALITGIYEELINSIRSVDGTLVQFLLKFRIKAVWERINGAFLLNVLLGILISIFSLARLITYLLDEHPIQVWSFFFGLILVSVFYVSPSKMKGSDYVGFILGAFIAYAITSFVPGETTESLWFVFMSGAIAICAMILPGISGSFILLLLGKYDYVLGAVKDLNLGVIAVFGLGCLVGIISFSKLIHWLLQHYKPVTMSVLAGFMLGSLNKIWPWKIDLDNVMPTHYSIVTGMDNYLGIAILFFILGIGIVVLLEQAGKQVKA